MGSEVSEARVIEVLRDILRINSENPPGNERPVAEALARYLRPIGFDVSCVEPEKGRTSLVAVLKGRGGGRSLILNGHMDIGPIGSGWTKNPLGGEIADGRIYGRGTGDMKSGLAAAVCASEVVVDSGIDRKGDLILTFVADESSGGHKGTGFLIKEKALEADMAVICEPTGGNIGIGHRGVVWVRVHIVGESGQAARPWSGVNAISCAGRVIAALDEQLPRLLEGREHAFIPSPTFSFGTIRGGIKTNVIAGDVEITIDRRTIPGERTEVVLDEITTIANQALVGTGAAVHVEADMVVEPSEIPGDSEVVAECVRAFKAVMGREPEQTGGGGYGFTDAHWFTNDLGIPAAIFGPWYLHLGEGSVSDIPDEFNYVEDIVLGTRVYAELIKNVIG
jgi:succinyl-diaminopimelate desuccinylase